jgi:hypothetical protein
MLAAKHFLRFRCVYLLFESIEGLRQIGGDVFAALRPLEQDADVIDFPGEAVAQLQVLRQPALALKRLLCFGLVVPEVGRGDFLFELG